MHFDKNLWHNYLTFLLITNENPFSLVCEKMGAQEGTVNNFVTHDFEMFKKLFDYDFSWMEKELSIDCFTQLTHYKAIRKKELMYNKNVSEKVRTLSEKLEIAKSGADFFKYVTEFYKDFGVGMFGLNKAFRIAENGDGSVRFLPINNRALTRMCTVSSGTFLAVNSAGSAIKAGIASEGNKAAFAKAFFLNINYPGIGRFAVACFFDAKYIKEDVATVYKKAMAEHERQKQLREQELQRLSAKYRFLTLNSDQTRLLCSFQSMMVAFDILNTKKADLALAKSKWKDEWEASVCESLDVTRDEFFIRSGRQAFGLMEEISNDVEDRSWIDLLVLELSRFTPYYQLGLEENKSYKKLKVKTDYLGDVFCKGQNYIGDTDVKAIQKAYTYAIGTITGNRKRVAAAAVATLAVTAATAGGALFFAPEIAVLIAGDAVVGLSGAALTSASLAFVGGGSLAVGGMGMSGGTAILTGGGALLGLAGSGVTTTATVAVQSSESFVQSECSKLLAFCSEIAVKKYGRYDIVVLAQQGMQKCAEELRTEIEELSNKENKPDKKLISQMKKSLKCMERCEKALEKLQDL